MDKPAEENAPRRPRYTLRPETARPAAGAPAPAAPAQPAADPFARAISEDDDGYDPFSDRPAASEPSYQEDPWR